ncbi:MAG: cation-translocating P-type ATPase [Nitrospirota bacterium]
MNRLQTIPWHSLAAEDVLREVGSSAGGLSEQEALRRLAEYGPNELKETAGVSPLSIFFNQFKNVLLAVLLVAVALSALMGHAAEAVVIGAIVLLAVVMGFIQEYRAERAVEALRALAAPAATVLRDGEERQVPARDLVPGDLLVLHTGDKVGADARLIEAVNLQAMEAVLTGESMPVEKDASLVSEAGASLGDRRNMLYAGTALTYGRGRGVVVQTGMTTEFGKIAGMLQTVERGRTPLQKELDRVGKRLVQAGLVVVALIVGAGLLRGEPLFQMFVWGIALAVAVVPEALPAVVTVSLALGVRRMVRRNALVRRLPAVETLGSTSVICTDKTGTLTKDEMTVRRIVLAGEEIDVTGSGYEPEGGLQRGGIPVGTTDSLWSDLVRLLRAGALCNDSRLRRGEAGWQIAGDPTEGALVVAAAKAGMEKASLENEAPRIGEAPFSSERKRMTTFHRGPDGLFACSKGAPEVILAACERRATPSGETLLDPPARERILDEARRLAGRGLRVLALADRALPEAYSAEEGERGMTLLGLVGIYDAPREEVPEAIRKCEAAGILPVMITGDHRFTAEAVAREIGLLKDGRVMTGADLDAMGAEEHARVVEEIRVYARVSPAHKLMVVEAFQGRGHVVAMTGDGVNDAPALKKADIGIAMGITGTDVSREAAAMTLTDDNFASIVAAVEEGRGIFGNIKKYLMYLLSANVGEIVLMASATLLGYPLPLSAVQILYVNLATDGLPALALAFDPPEKDLMERPPRDPRQGIFTRPVVALMAVGGLWSAGVNMGLFAWLLSTGASVQRAMGTVFVTLILIEFGKAYNFRSDRHSIFGSGFWSNRWLNIAIAWEIALLAAVVYAPGLRDVFQTASLSPADLVVPVAAALTIFPVLEAAKLAVRKGWLGRA